MRFVAVAVAVVDDDEVMLAVWPFEQRNGVQATSVAAAAAERRVAVSDSNQEALGWVTAEHSYHTLAVVTVVDRERSVVDDESCGFEVVGNTSSPDCLAFGRGCSSMIG